jgi:hypothetical protein
MAYTSPEGLPGRVSHIVGTTIVTFSVLICEIIVRIFTLLESVFTSYLLEIFLSSAILAQRCYIRI